MAAGKVFPTRRLLLILLVLLGLSCFDQDLTSQAQTLPQQEVKALRQIALKLKKEWDFSVDPCSGAPGWVDSTSSSSPVTNNLTCDCNSTSNICHVTSIQLGGQNLSGVLPEEFANLTSLSVIDLRLNYLNGSIPAASWASLSLITLDLFGNRLSGRIPIEIGSIITLQFLVLEDNQLEGLFPPALGKLINLNSFRVSGNNFTGELPEELGNLKNLTDLRIDGNPISGKIPSFIGNWTNLQRLQIQGTSMEGPFPSIFSTLETITLLAVSDLKGGIGEFPPLQKMKNMRDLVLRNLSISGEIPDYIGEMTDLKTLDLSFNKLTGAIPSNFAGLQRLTHMYLTNNMLNGSIPSWMMSSTQYLDISHNTFTGSPAPSSCQKGNVNLVSSYSSTDSDSLATCLRRSIPCSEKATNYKFFINCGGNKVTIDGDEYEEDTSQLGSSIYGPSTSGKWAYSSTGNFMSTQNAKFIAANTSVLNITNPDLYMTARLSPLSLKYYGLCLQKGNYLVKLQFAEISFTDDQTFSSLGKRLFDVSIQGQKVLQDFNIAEEANGTGQEIIKAFNSIVDGSTLEIHFQWAGKGTTALTKSGTYGPLISAISVTANVDPETGSNKLSVGSISGIVAASCLVIVLILILLWLCLRTKDPENNGYKHAWIKRQRSA